MQPHTIEHKSVLDWGTARQILKPLLSPKPKAKTENLVKDVINKSGKAFQFLATHDLQCMKSKIKTILECSIIPVIIIVCIVGCRACDKRHEKERDRLGIAAKNEHRNKMCNYPFLLLDKNMVYHIDPNCNNLNLRYIHIHYTDDNYITEDIDKSYSAAYVSKDSIYDWYLFASTHQLCTRCFSLEMLQIFDSVYMDKYRDEDEEYYNLRYNDGLTDRFKSMSNGFDPDKLGKPEPKGGL